MEGWNGCRDNPSQESEDREMSWAMWKYSCWLYVHTSWTCVSGGRRGQRGSLVHFHLWQDLPSAGILHCPCCVLLPRAPCTSNTAFVCVCYSGWKRGFPCCVVAQHPTKMDTLICSQTTGASPASRFGKLLPAVSQSSSECRFPALNMCGESSGKPVGLKLAGSLTQPVQRGSLLHRVGSSVPTSKRAF